MGFPWNVSITWNWALINFDKQGARQRNCVQQAESLVYWWKTSTWLIGDVFPKILDVMEASTFLVPRKAYSNALKMTASITSPFATMRYCKTLCIRVHTHNGIFETGIMQELLNG
jgi:hypothetical protein